jgi:hypothetical protein
MDDSKPNLFLLLVMGRQLAELLLELMVRSHSQAASTGWPLLQAKEKYD